MTPTRDGRELYLARYHGEPRPRKPRQHIVDLLMTDERAAYLKMAGLAGDATKVRTASVKREVVTLLGGVCACCGEGSLRMLSIDHRQNDGNRERSGCIYRKVRQNPDLDRYQLLCLNCNGAKERGRECQHQREARAIIWQNVAA
jgi:hypothetical protein